MNKRKQWIMQNSTLNSFDKYRLQKYRSVGIKGEVDDDLLTQYYTYIIVHFFRKRRGSKDEPFKIQRFVHTAISLYKRFYLVNQYGDNQQLQIALCCIYLSLKLNQVSNISLQQYSKAWKAKKTQQYFGEDCIHFGDQAYSEKQLHLLRGIGFQIGRSPMIPAIESLVHILRTCVTENQQIVHVNQTIEKYILQLIRRVYIDHKAIFIYEGPVLGLAIVICSIKLSGLQQKINKTVGEILGEQISKLMQRNQMQINEVVQYLTRLQKFEPNESELKLLKDKLIKTKKKTFQVPQKKSPRVTPLSFEFNQ